MQKHQIIDFVTQYIAYLALAVIVVVFGILVPERFLTSANLGVILQNSAVLSIVAMGITFVIISGSIDLSVGSIIALSGAIAATFTPQMGAWAFVFAPIVGGGLGMINGLIFTRARIPSFVVTLGMLSMARGVTVIYSGGSPVRIPLDSDYYIFGTPPVPVIIVAVVAVVMAGLLKYTTFGRYIFAIGGDEDKTRILGVNCESIKTWVFVISGMLAGVGGGILTSQIGSGSPTIGTGFELMAISAVVIGGTPLTGGNGSIIGTIVGSLVIQTLANGLIIVGISSNVQTVMTGAVLILAVMISIRRGKLRIIK